MGFVMRVKDWVLVEPCCYDGISPAQSLSKVFQRSACHSIDSL